MEIRVQLAEAGSFLKHVGPGDQAHGPRLSKDLYLLNHLIGSMPFNLISHLYKLSSLRPLHQSFPTTGLFKCCPRRLPDYHSTQFSSQHFLLFGVTLFTP